MALKDRRFVVMVDTDCGPKIITTCNKAEEAKAAAVRYTTTEQRPAYVAEVYEWIEPQPPQPIEVKRYQTFKGVWAQKPLHA